jgi:hypothetical protein
MDILSHLAPSVELPLFFSPTEASVAAFREIAPQGLVYQSPLKLDVLERAMQLQRDLAPLNKQREMLICADDCSYQKEVWRSTVWRDATMNGRHNRAGLVCTVQYAVDMPSDCRGQFDFVVACFEGVHANKKRLWQFFQVTNFSTRS